MTMDLRERSRAVRDKNRLVAARLSEYKAKYGNDFMGRVGDKPVLFPLSLLQLSTLVLVTDMSPLLHLDPVIILNIHQAFVDEMTLALDELTGTTPA